MQDKPWKGPIRQRIYRLKHDGKDYYCNFCLDVNYEIMTEIHDHLWQILESMREITQMFQGYRQCEMTPQRFAERIAEAEEEFGKENMTLLGDFTAHPYPRRNWKNLEKAYRISKTQLN